MLDAERIRDLFAEHKAFEERIDRLHRSARGSRVTFFNFSNSPLVATPGSLRLSVYLLRSELRDRGAEVHVLGPRHVAAIADETAYQAAEGAEDALRRMAPGADWAVVEAANPDQKFAVTFDLPMNFPTCSMWIEQVLAEVKADLALEQKQSIAATGKSGKGGKGLAQVPLPVQLEFLEDQLLNSDFRQSVRIQPIARIIESRLVEIDGQEAFTSITEIQRRFGTDIPIQDNYLMLRHLTVHLDLQMLTLLADHPGFFGTRLRTHFNLAVGSLSSEGFVHLDAETDAEAHGHVALEFDITDALAHASDLTAATRYLSGRRFSVVLDGVPVEMLGHVRFDDIAFSHLKLIWRPGMGVPDDLARQVQALDDKGVEVILCRCDNQKAVDWGQSVGIELFQGAHVDSLATKAFHGTCPAQAKLGCSVGDCRARHWAPQKMEDFPCPRPFWTSPEA